MCARKVVRVPNRPATGNNTPPSRHRVAAASRRIPPPESFAKPTPIIERNPKRIPSTANFFSTSPLVRRIPFSEVTRRARFLTLAICAESSVRNVSDESCAKSFLPDALPSNSNFSHPLHFTSCWLENQNHGSLCRSPQVHSICRFIRSPRSKSLRRLTGECVPILERHSVSSRKCGEREKPFPTETSRKGTESDRVSWRFAFEATNQADSVCFCAGRRVGKIAANYANRVDSANPWSSETHGVEFYHESSRSQRNCCDQPFMSLQNRSGNRHLTQPE